MANIKLVVDVNLNVTYFVSANGLRNRKNTDNYLNILISS